MNGLSLILYTTSGSQSAKSNTICFSATHFPIYLDSARMQQIFGARGSRGRPRERIYFGARAARKQNPISSLWPTDLAPPPPEAAPPPP